MYCVGGACNQVISESLENKNIIAFINETKVEGQTGFVPAFEVFVKSPNDIEDTWLWKIIIPIDIEIEYSKP